MIGVLTFLRSRPDRPTQTIDALRTLITPSLQDPGCLAMQLHVDPRDACRLMLYEQWRSKTDFDVNGALPQFQWFWQNREDFLQDDVDVQFYEVVEATDTSPHPAFATMPVRRRKGGVANGGEQV